MPVFNLIWGNGLYISSYLYTFEMAKPIQDDFNGTLINAEDDTVYTLTLTKKGMDEEGKRYIMKVDLDIGQESANELVFSKFQPKIIQGRWEKYVPPTPEQKAIGKKGHFEKARK